MSHECLSRGSLFGARQPKGAKTRTRRLRRGGRPALSPQGCRRGIKYTCRCISDPATCGLEAPVGGPSLALVNRRGLKLASQGRAGQKAPLFIHARDRAKKVFRVSNYHTTSGALLSGTALLWIKKAGTALAGTFYGCQRHPKTIMDKGTPNRF